MLIPVMALKTLQETLGHAELGRFLRLDRRRPYKGMCEQLTNWLARRDRWHHEPCGDRAILLHALRQQTQPPRKQLRSQQHC